MQFDEDVFPFSKSKSCVSGSPPVSNSLSVVTTLLTFMSPPSLSTSLVILDAVTSDTFMISPQHFATSNSVVTLVMSILDLVTIPHDSVVIPSDLSMPMDKPTSMSKRFFRKSRLLF